MPLIGLILLAVAVIVAVELVLANKGAITVHLWKWDYNIHAWGMAAWGAAILFVALLGWWMIWRGSARRLRRRRERRVLAAENEELAQRVDAAETSDVQPVTGESNRRGRFGRREEAAAAGATAAGAAAADQRDWGRTTTSTAAGDPTRANAAPAEESTRAYAPNTGGDQTRAYPTPAAGGAPNEQHRGVAAPAGEPDQTQAIRRDEATSAYPAPAANPYPEAPDAPSTYPGHPQLTDEPPTST